MASWKNCVLWLKEIGFLPDKHRILGSETDLSDLVDLLQDGSVLCYVLHFIDSSSIDIRRVHNHSYGSEISSFHNAQLFLNSCLHVYHIPSEYLFDAKDLYWRYKFENVLLSLSRISKSQHFANCRTQKRYRVITFDLSIEAEFDIYAGIEDKISDLTLEDEDTIYGQVDHESEDIYEELIYARYKMEELAEAEASVPVKRDKKSLVINELVETEKEYVRVLDVIINHYWRSLKSIVPADKLSKMFCNNCIHNLLEYHIGLVSDMENAIEMGHPIAGTLITWQPKLANYAHYFAAMDEAVATIDLCMKDASFRKQLDHLKATADIQQCRFNLGDVLRVPGQRVLKYHLLIDSLKKAIPPEDFHELSTTETACDKLKDLNSYMNESKRDAELKKKLLTLRESIQDSELFRDVLCYGKLLKDGELKVKFEGGETTMKKCHVFLFQRAILFSKDRSDFLSNSKNYESKFKVLFSDFEVEDQSPKSNYVVLKHKSIARQIILSCKNSTFQSEWYQMITDAANSSDPDKLCHNLHQFELSSFTEVKKCYACDRLLKGAFCQGYKCISCQCLAHRECLSRFTQCIRSRRSSRGDNPNLIQQKPMLVVRPQPHLDRPSTEAKQSLVSTVYRAAYPLNQANCLFILPGDKFEVFNDDFDCSFGLKARKVQTGELGYVPLDYVNELLTLEPNCLERRSSNNSSGSSTMVCNANPVDDSLKDYPWFTHVQSREISSKNCLMCPDSTFLVRKSESAMTYALMVHYSKVIRNIRIETNHEGRWYIAPEINFPTIPDLVDFYQCNSLQSNFPQLPTTLITPFYEGVQKLKTMLMRSAPPQNRPLYVGLGQMLENHIPVSDNRELEIYSGELVKIISFSSNSSNPSFWKVEALKKYEINNRDPEYLPVKGLVPGCKVKVF